MDKVWVVLEVEIHEGQKILKIFSNYRAAQLWVYNQEWTNKAYKTDVFWLKIEEFPVDHAF